MKRLLAWSSIENLGIIFTGIGLAIVFHGVGMHALAALALIAALYHSLNHAFMKSLLFLRHRARCCIQPASATSDVWAA